MDRRHFDFRLGPTVPIPRPRILITISDLVYTSDPCRIFTPDGRGWSIAHSISRSTSAEHNNYVGNHGHAKLPDFPSKNSVGQSHSQLSSIPMFPIPALESTAKRRHRAGRASLEINSCQGGQRKFVAWTFVFSQSNIHLWVPSGHIVYTRS